jgi:hypothetical protein
MDKRSLTERDICTKFILPAVKRAGWDEMVQVREEVYFTKGRIIVRGKLVTRGESKNRRHSPPFARSAARRGAGFAQGSPAGGGGMNPLPNTCEPSSFRLH